MMAKLENPHEMELIYQTSKQVYSGMLTASAAAKLLVPKTPVSEASLKMYFTIYACMRKGTCYKMGTSAAFTKFLIERIHEDEGGNAILVALASAKQNAEYRKQCNNEQPGIESVCREIISSHKLRVKYETLDGFNGKGNTASSAKPSVKKKDFSIQKLPSGSLRMKIVIGAIEFEAEGDPETVIDQQRTFTKELLPNALASLSQTCSMKAAVALDGQEKEAKNAKPSQSKTKGTQTNEGIKKIDSVGVRIAKKYLFVQKLSNRMDFKAKMAPLLYLASEAKYQVFFSIAEIKQLMAEAIGFHADTKQIKDVLQRRPDWFELQDGVPKKYRLVDVGRDYAKNILNEYQ